MNWTSMNFKLRSRLYLDLIYQSGSNLFEGYVGLVQNTSWTSETLKLRISAVDHTGIWLIRLDSIYLKVKPVWFRTWVEMETPLLTLSDWLTSPWLTAAGPDNKFCKRFQTNTRSLVSLSLMVNHQTLIIEETQLVFINLGSIYTPVYMLSVEPIC